MKHLFNAVCAAGLAVAGLSARAQDVAFSQYYEQPFQRNPALAGIFTGDLRVVSSFRNQWQSVTVPYRTFGTSTELKLPLNAISGDNVTFGLQLMGDVAGSSKYKTYQVMPAINYSVPLSLENNSFLSLGVMGGLRLQDFETGGLLLNDQILTSPNGTFTILPTSRQTFNHTSNRAFDLSAGLSYNGAINNVDYYLGAGMFHLTSPEIGFMDKYNVRLHKKLAFNFGLAAPLGENDQLMIYGDYFSQYSETWKRVGIHSIQTGLLLSHDVFVDGDERKAITFGALYRLQDAVIPVLRLELPKFTVGMSYDVNVSKLARASQGRGGLEFTFSYKKAFDFRQNELRQTVCPRFGAY